MTELQRTLRDMIVNVLNLEDITDADLGVDDDLFSEKGLALDSIDALELGVAIQKQYGIKLDSKDDQLRAHFKSIRSLAELVETQATKGTAA